MRASLLVLALAIPLPAFAQGFGEVGGGVMIPAADNNWTGYVDASPKLFLRVGGLSGNIGGMLAFDWTPINTDAQGWTGPFSTGEIHANRYRILVNLVAQTKVGPKLTARGRFGAGLDVQHIDYIVRVGGFRTETGSTDNGFALEAAGGFWYDLGPVDVGIDLALPISFHSYDSSNNIQLRDFTSLDVDLLFGVRFVGERQR